MSSLNVALLQYTAVPEADTQKTITPMMTMAAAKGAQLIALPECATRLDPDRARLKATVDRQEDSAALASFCDFARLHHVWISVGSIMLKADGGGDDQRLVNRSVMINPDGMITATYDKIHMFDVIINADEQYHESAHYQPGDQAVITPVHDAMIGMSICYDIRFPIFISI